MNIVRLTKGIEDDWRSFIERHPDATIYHTLQWKTITEQAFGFKPHYFVACDEEGIQAVLPMFSCKWPGTERMISLPMRDRGGIVCRSEMAASKLMDTVICYSDEHGIRGLTIKSSCPFSSAIAQMGRISQDFVRVVSALPKQSSELNHKLKGKPVMRAIEKSRKLGVTVIESDDEREWRAFYRLFLETRRRIGVPPYSYRYFCCIREILVPERYAFLLMAKWRDEYVAGMIFFRYNEEMIYAFGASKAEAWECRPNDRLIYEAMCRAVTDGISRFDFGADHPSNSGLLAFKRKWFAMSVPIYHLHVGADVVRDPLLELDTLKMRICSRVIKCLPMPLYKMMSCIPPLMAS